MIEAQAAAVLDERHEARQPAAPAGGRRPPRSPRARTGRAPRLVADRGVERHRRQPARAGLALRLREQRARGPARGGSGGRCQRVDVEGAVPAGWARRRLPSPVERAAPSGQRQGGAPRSAEPQERATSAARASSTGKAAIAAGDATVQLGHPDYLRARRVARARASERSSSAQAARGRRRSGRTCRRRCDGASRAAAWKSAGPGAADLSQAPPPPPRGPPRAGWAPSPARAAPCADCGRGVPEEEVELTPAAAAAACAPPATIASPAAASAAASGTGIDRRDAPAPGQPHRGLGELAEAHVAVAEDVALARLARARPPAAGRAASAGRVDDAHAARRQQPAPRSLAPERRAEAGLARATSRRRRARARRPPAGFTITSSMPSRPRGERELLGPLLGALVGRALRVVGHLRLVEARRRRSAWKTSIVDVWTTRRAPAARSRPHHGLGAARVDAVEDVGSSANHCSGSPIALKTSSQPARRSPPWRGRSRRP